MARSWLQVMTGEILAKEAARERIAAYRADNAAVVQACLSDVVLPALRAAAEARGWRLDEQTDSAATLGRVRITAAGSKPAYAEVAVDAVNPVAVLRRYPGGADAIVETRAIRCAELDRAALDAWLEAS